MYRPSQSPRLTLSSDRIAAGVARRWRLDTRKQEPKSQTIKVVVFQLRIAAPTYATPLMSLHKVRTRVKLNRVFFPRLFSQARSLGCGFAR